MRLIGVLRKCEQKIEQTTIEIIKKNASQKIEQTTIEIIEETASNQIEQIASKQKETAINKIAYITHSKAYFYILPKILTTLLGKPPLGIW